MIDQTAQLHELPDYWQEKIRQYRSENHSLRKRLRATESLSDQALPPSWAKKLRKLRDENVQIRKERNEARSALLTLDAAVSQSPTCIPAWLSADIDRLRASGGTAAEASIARMQADRDEALAEYDRRRK